MTIRVEIEGKPYLITKFERERVQVSQANGVKHFVSGRHIMTLTTGEEIILPYGVLPKAPCKFCHRMKPLNEYCEATERCAREHKKAMDTILRMHQGSKSTLVS